jgi:cell division protein FtsL
MAEVAYDLSRFAPTRRKPRHDTGDAVTRLRVQKRVSAAKLQRRRQVMGMVRTLMAVLLLLALVCAVLYTQTRLTELSREITDTEAELKEEKALNAYLTFELDNMTTLKNIEDKAAELGMERVSNDQIAYYRVEDSNGIRVRGSPLAALFDTLKGALAGLIDGLGL